MMRSESSNYKLGRLDKVLVLKFVLTPTDPDTEFKMVRGRTIKNRPGHNMFDEALPKTFPDHS